MSFHKESRPLEEKEASTRSEHFEGKLSTRLHLKFQRKKNSFRGLVNLRFHLKKDWKRPFLDFNGKNISKFMHNGHTAFFENSDERIQFQSLKRGEHVIEIEFESYYSHSSMGMHQYLSKEGDQNYEYYYSNLCPYAAHTVFPCFDQPDLKSEYLLSVDIPKEWNAVSNYPIHQRKEEGKQKHIIFEKTCPMSSYLFNLCVGDYDEHLSKDSRLPMRVFCRKEKSKDFKPEEVFPLIETARKFYEEQFDYPYPFPKYDQIFVPEFNWGAMENIGAVVIREEHLFDHEPGAEQFFSRANTLVHELAHMWFGNLVTMKWWGDLWLNEAFATYSAYLCLQRTGEFEESMQRFLKEVKLPAYAIDQSRATHSVIVDCSDTATAFANFDAITYLKGASLLKQLVSTVGEDDFVKGIQSYFKKFSFRNATSLDFLKTLEDHSHENFDPFQFSKEWLQTTGVDSIYLLRNGQEVEIQKSKHPYPRHHALDLYIYKLEDQPKLLEKKHFTIGSERLQLQVPKDSLLIINAEDFQYCKAYLDEYSLDWVLENLYKIEDSFLQALLLNRLTTMLRDSYLDLPRYVDSLIISVQSSKRNSFQLECLSALAYWFGKGAMQSRKDAFMNWLEVEIPNAKGEFLREMLLCWVRLSEAKKQPDQLWAYLETYKQDKKLAKVILKKLCTSKKSVSQKAYQRIKLEFPGNDSLFFQSRILKSGGKQRQKYFEKLLDPSSGSAHYLGEGMSVFFLRDAGMENFVRSYFQAAKKFNDSTTGTYLKKFLSNLFPVEYPKLSHKLLKENLKKTGLLPQVRREFHSYQHYLEQVLRVLNSQ